MKLLFALIAIGISIIVDRSSKKKTGRRDEGRTETAPRRSGARTGTAPRSKKAPQRPTAALSQQKRKLLANLEQWQLAKEQQDDAEQLHSLGMDSCEGKLESLRVLYQAGILEREEYNERVARTKAKHAHGTQNG